MKTIAWVVPWVLLTVGCDRKEAERRLDPPPPSKNDDLRRIKSATPAACEGEVALQVAAPAHQEIVNAIEAAKRDGFESELGPAKDLPDIAAKIEAAKKQLAEDLAPAKPEKPIHEKPKYSGAWPISGRCRGRYNENEGIVIQADGKYYVVKDSEPCETPYVNGFVENTGETVTLALGRDGREADVVVLKDRETYLDDQKAYRDKVARAQADYQQAVKDYPQRVREWQDEVAAAARKRQSTVATRDNLAKQWLVVLGCTGTSAAMTAPPVPARHDGVDPDCYGEGQICSKARLADAEALDDLVSGAITKAGFPAGCYQVRYIAGDNGGKDTISVMVTADCKSGTSTSKSLLGQLANMLTRLVAGKPLARNVDLVQVTDGDKIEAQAPLAAVATKIEVSEKPAARRTDVPESTSPPATPAPPTAPRADEPRTSGDRRTPAADGCDEVSCAVNKYDAPCCAKFKKAAKPPD